jgi:hypothetical protein
MLTLALFVAFVLFLGLASSLGWTVDSREAGGWSLDGSPKEWRSD